MADYIMHNSCYECNYKTKAFLGLLCTLTLQIGLIRLRTSSRTPPLDKSVNTNLVSQEEWEGAQPLATPSLAGIHKSGLSTSVEKEAEFVGGAGHTDCCMENSIC